MTFGEKLVSLREERNMSRKELAESLEMPYTTLRNYETDQREPGHKLLIKLSSLFSISVDELIGNSNRQQNEASLKNNNMSLISAEHGIIKKYRALDEHGKDIVDTVLDKEYKRTQEADRSRHDYTRSVLTLAANADKAAPGALDDDVLNDILAQADKLQEKEKTRRDE